MSSEFCKKECEGKYKICDCWIPLSYNHLAAACLFWASLINAKLVPVLRPEQIFVFQQVTHTCA